MNLPNVYRDLEPAEGGAGAKERRERRASVQQVKLGHADREVTQAGCDDFCKGFAEGFQLALIEKEEP